MNRKILAITVVMSVLLCGWQSFAETFVPNPSIILAPVEPPPEVGAVAGQEEFPFPADSLRSRLILARVYSRKGKYARARKIYEKLVREFPGDDAIWEQYVEIIVQNDDLELADSLVEDRLKKNPDDRSALRLKTLILAEDEAWDESLPYHRKRMELRPDDMDALADSAYAHQGAGDWQTAAQQFSELLDNNPENEDAWDALNTILLERRPRGTFLFENEARDRGVHINHGSALFGMYASNDLRLEAAYDLWDVNRPEQPFLTRVNSTIHDLRLRATQDFSRDFSAMLGGGYFFGDYDGFTGEGALSYDTRDAGIVGLEGMYNRPWADDPDAVDNKGTYHEVAGTYQLPFFQRWFFSARGGVRQYELDGKTYGDRKFAEFFLTRRLMDRPELNLTYGLQWARSNYADHTFTPVGLLEKEMVHSLVADWTHWFCNKMAYRLTVGGSQDEFKDDPSYNLGAEFLVKAGNRAQVRVGYGYNSDAGDFEGGVSRRLQIGFDVVF